MPGTEEALRKGRSLGSFDPPRPAPPAPHQAPNRRWGACRDHAARGSGPAFPALQPPRGAALPGRSPACHRVGQGTDPPGCPPPRPAALPEESFPPPRGSWLLRKPSRNDPGPTGPVQEELCPERARGKARGASPQAGGKPDARGAAPARSPGRRSRRPGGRSRPRSSPGRPGRVAGSGGGDPGWPGARRPALLPAPSAGSGLQAAGSRSRSGMGAPLPAPAPQGRPRPLAAPGLTASAPTALPGSPGAAAQGVGARSRCGLQPAGHPSQGAEPAARGPEWDPLVWTGLSRSRRLPPRILARSRCAFAVGHVWFAVQGLPRGKGF